MTNSINVLSNDRILVSNEIASAAANVVGMQVHWRISGSLSRSAITQVFGGMFDAKHLPAEISNNEALKRALESLKDTNKLVRKFSAKGNKGFTVVVEDPTKLDMDEANEDDSAAYSKELTASIIVEDGKEKLRVTPKGHPAVTQIAEAFVANRTTLSSHDLSLWLSKEVMGQLHAISARDRGGIYFIPPTEVAKLRRVEELLKGLSTYDGTGRLRNGVKLYTIPFVESHAIVEIVLDSFMDQLDLSVKAAYEGLADTDKKKNAASFKKLSRILSEQLEHAEKYAHILGESFAAIKERVEDAATAVGIAQANYLNELETRRAKVRETGVKDEVLEELEAPYTSNSDLIEI